MIENVNSIIQASNTPHNDFLEKIASALGTKKFIFWLTSFFVIWIIGNYVGATFFHYAFDPVPFLLISTAINLYSAYTSSILIFVDNAQKEREKIQNDYFHQLQIKGDADNKEILALLKAIIKIFNQSTKSIKVEKTASTVKKPRRKNGYR